MAVIPSVPSTVALALQTGLYKIQRLIPKDLEGAVLDMTGFNAGSLDVYPDQSGLGLPTTISVPPTLYDATGTSLYLTPANIAAIVEVAGLSRAWYTYTVTDGTDTVQAGQGNCQVAFGF